MEKYRSWYNNIKQNRYMIQNGLNRCQSSGDYDTSSLSVRLNEAHSKIAYDYYNRQLEALDSMLLKEVFDEVYNQVMKNIDISFKNDSLQFSKTIASDISRELKSIGMK